MSVLYIFRARLLLFCYRQRARPHPPNRPLSPRPTPTPPPAAGHEPRRPPPPCLDTPPSPAPPPPPPPALSLPAEHGNPRRDPGGPVATLVVPAGVATSQAARRARAQGGRGFEELGGRGGIFGGEKGEGGGVGGGIFRRLRDAVHQLDRPKRLPQPHAVVRSRPDSEAQGRLEATKSSRAIERL
ncbi:hypothetical protein BU14_0031s0101 [Porphyra umbilicalis]|uniref:Uncharacterized protein n=1 Tax=Porphyra umbilicalis TaxID=2786 RepID=A0A1X6PJA6_PORUM|nr:hypothetical protein BU14_0031s0101 [Porphyra umbilicalis]|eukprot:OSX80932.1 hypothetical protein BU14_0031s0101 [Porphyra umbilicalis]